jgi:hypothetical protein
MITLALAVIVPLSMLIYSNSRISEAKETLRAEMGMLRLEIKSGFERLEAKLGFRPDEDRRGKGRKSQWTAQS